MKKWIMRSLLLLSCVTVFMQASQTGVQPAQPKKSAKKPGLTKEEKAIVKKFVTGAIEENQKVYQAAFGNDAQVAQDLKPGQKAMVAFLKTIQDSRLREMLFFLACDAPNLDKIFSSYDISEIIGGFFTTTKTEGFDAENPLDATFQRLITVGESVLNVINTLDDESRVQLNALLQMAQPAAESFARVQRAAFFAQYPDLQAKLLDPKLSQQEQENEIRMFLQSNTSFQAQEAVKQWRIAAVASTVIPDTGFFLTHKALVDQLVTSNSPNAKKLENQAETLGTTPESLKRMWPTLRITKKVFGYISKAKTALNLQHRLTNMARVAQGKKAIQHKDRTFQNAKEFNSAFKKSWLDTARTLGPTAIGKAFVDAAQKGSVVISDIVLSVRDGKLQEQGSKLADDINVLIANQRRDATKVALGEFTFVDIVKRYVLPSLQKAGAQIDIAQANLLAEQDSILVGSVAKGVKSTIAEVVEAVGNIFHTVVQKGLEQDSYAAMKDSLVEAATTPVDVSKELAIISRYISGQDIDLKELLTALTKTSYEKVLQDFEGDATFKILYLLKVAQVMTEQFKDKASQAIESLSDEAVITLMNQVQKQIDSMPKGAMLDDFKMQLESPETVKKITEIVAKSKPEQNEKSTQEDEKQKFYEMDLEQFNEMYVKHFSGQPDVATQSKTPELTGNPLIDTLRTFPPKLRSLAFSLVSLGSAEGIFETAMAKPNGKKNIWKVIKTSVSAAFGGISAKERDPFTNYMTRTLDTAFTLLNVLDTAKPSDRDHLTSLLEFLKPIREIAMSAQMSKLYTLLLAKAPLTISQEEFDTKTTADKMEILNRYFEANPSDQLQDVFKQFNTIKKITTQVDGALFYIQHKEVIDESRRTKNLVFVHANPQEYVAATLKMNPDEVAAVWDDTVQVKKYFWWALKARSVVRGLQAACNWFRSKANQVEYQQNHYQDAQSLTEDIKRSPLGNIMEFAQTKTGQFIVAKTQAIGKQIMWVLEAQGTEAIKLRVAEVVKDLKKIDPKKIKPLVKFVQQFVSAEQAAQITKTRSDLAEQLKPFPRVGQAAHAILEALKEIHTSLTQIPDEVPSEQESDQPIIDMKSIAEGMAANLQKNGTKDALQYGDSVLDAITGDDALSQRGVEGVITDVVEIALDVVTKLEVVRPVEQSMAEKFTQMRLQLCRLKIASMAELKNSEDYDKIANEMITQLLDVTELSAMIDEKTSLADQLVEFGTKLDAVESQKVIRDIIQKQIPEVLPSEDSSVLQQKDLKRIEQASLRAQLAEVFNTSNKDAMRVGFADLVESLITKHMEKNPALFVSLMQEVIESITPKFGANNLIVEKSAALFDALQESIEKLPGTPLKEWIEKSCTTGKRYTEILSKKSSPLLRLELAECLIDQYKDNQQVEEVLQKNGQFSKTFAITTVENRTTLLQSIAKVIPSTPVFGADTFKSQLKVLATSFADVAKMESPDEQQAFMNEMNKTIKNTVFKKEVQDKIKPQSQTVLQEPIEFDGVVMDSNIKVITPVTKEVPKAASTTSTISDGKPKGATKSKGGFLSNLFTPTKSNNDRRRQQQEDKGNPREFGDVEHGAGEK